MFHIYILVLVASKQEILYEGVEGPLKIKVFNGLKISIQQFKILKLGILSRILT